MGYLDRAAMLVAAPGKVKATAERKSLSSLTSELIQLRMRDFFVLRILQPI
jgi:hypothetical protein